MFPIYIFILLTFVSSILAIKYDYSLIEWLILFVTTILSFLYFRKLKNIKDNISVLFVIAYIFLSVHVMALFEMTSVGFAKDVIYPNEYRLLAIWGNHLFLVLFATILLFAIFNKRKKKRIICQQGPPVLRNNCPKNEALFEKTTKFVYILCVFCFITGISNLTRPPDIVLPFHLNGLIDEFHSVTYQFIFAIFVYDSLIKQGTVKKKYIFLYVIYVILEVFVRASKGVLLGAFLPAVIMMICMGRMSKKIVIRYLMPAVLIFVFAYSIIEQVRRADEFSVEAVQNAAKKSRSDSESGSSPYIRAFLTGMYYVKVVDIVDQDNFSFDFRRVPVLYLMRGGVNYMTYEIDGFSENDYQSSGVTGLIDALLWGGYPLCWIVLIIIVIIALLTDNSIWIRKKKIYAVIMFFFLYTLLTGRTLTLFIDELVFPTFTSILIKIYLTHLYYKRLY